jgi:rhamnogalacturonan acetylesterase
MTPNSYGPIGQAAAEQVGAGYLDLNGLIIKKYEPLGKDKVTELYFPEGETTHTDWSGAVLNSECVIDGLKELKSPVVQYLKSEPPKDLKNPTGKAR